MQSFSIEDVSSVCKDLGLKMSSAKIEEDILIVTLSELPDQLDTVRELNNRLKELGAVYVTVNTENP